MKKNVIISLSLVICIFMIIAFPIVCNGATTGLGDLNAYSGGNAGNSAKLEEMTEQILGIIQIIGTIVSVAMLIVIGIKYMTGSIEEKAEYKETLKPYLIGAFLLFSGSSVPQIIYQLAKNM